MSCDAVIKNDVFQDVEEEVIEEVIEDEQVWMGDAEEGGYYQAHDMMEHQVIEYDDYQAFLPVRGGDAYWTMNLPDLMSKIHSFPQPDGTSVRLITCFNRRCHRQIAFKGYLYTVKDWILEHGWTTWKCINEQCFGELRTHSPDYSDIRIEHDHVATCLPDENQIAIRIGVYDARLLAEFTETPLAPLYEGVQEKMKAECPEVPKELFPSFEAIQASLLDHRHNKIYRKRFEMQKFREKQKKMNMTADEVLFAENAAGMIKPRRTKPFPMSLCGECNENLISTNLPSQDQLIHHLMYTHGRRLTIERYEFKDIAHFEHYIRELNANSRFKVRRFGLADENMYYLCVHDDRLAKNGQGRASRLQQQNCHCTAFLRVFDWRIVTKQEGSRITVDYCLEHQPHPYAAHETSRFLSRSSRGPGVYQKEYIDYFTPEVFARDLEDKKIRFQKITAGDLDSVVLKKPLEMKTYCPPGRVRVSFGARALAPPLAAQLAAGTSQPYVDVYASGGGGGAENQTRSPKFLLRQPMRTSANNKQDEPVESTSPIPGPSSQGMVPQEEDPNQPPPRIFLTQKVWSRQTERQNFKDVYTFNAVCKVEDACMSLLNRLQTCQHARIGLGYREKIAMILRNANGDPGLIDNTTEEQMATSWVLQKPIRGRPRKRACVDEDGEEGEDRGDGDDEEEEDVDMEGEEEEERGHNVVEKKGVEPEVDVEKEVVAEKEDMLSSESPKPSTSAESQGMITTGPLSPPEARETQSETVESASSNVSPNTSPSYLALETTTRSGRSRKAPARLQE